MFSGITEILGDSGETLIDIPPLLLDVSCEWELFILILKTFFI